jgi:hypothetical protein
VFVSFTIDEDLKLVKVKFQQKVTVQDVKSYLQQLRDDPRFNTNYSELVDLTDVNQSEINFKIASDLARSADPFSHNARRAFAAPHAAVFGTTRMYQMIRQDEENMRCFHTMEQAKTWLGIND